MQGTTSQYQYIDDKQEFHSIEPDSPLLLPIVEDSGLSEEEFYESRIQAITDLVANKKLTLESIVTQDRVLNILDDIGGTPFDREIADQLFEKIPQDQLKYVNDRVQFKLRAFVETYIKAEYLLILQIRDTHRELVQTNQEIKQAQEQLDDALRNEILNVNNLSINSSLYINVVEAITDSNTFRPASGSSYTVMAVCNKYKYESDDTDKLTQNFEFNPRFNYDFHIKMETGDEKIILMLRENNYKNLANPVLRSWKATFGLQTYLDQTEHETWLKLYDEKNNYAKLQLHCVIQFRFSDAKFFQDTIKSLQEVKDKLVENKAILERSLLNLVDPFIPKGDELELEQQNYNTANGMNRDSYQ